MKQYEGRVKVLSRVSNFVELDYETLQAITKQLQELGGEYV